MESPPLEINVITLNCWGLKYLSKYRIERSEEIGRCIANATPVPHIVALQECWTQEGYRSIRRATKRILPYGKFYYSGVFGGGLAILSQWPIEESSMFQYPLNGRPTAFFRGDWYVGKGVACARIRIGSSKKDILEVFTTHLHAAYSGDKGDSYACHRVAQAWEIAKLMRGAAERGHLVIGLGDFNMLPLSLPHRIISTHAPVQDIWRVLHPDSSVGPALNQVEQARRRPIPTSDYNILENGATCDGVINTWKWNKAQQQQLRRNEPHAEVPGDTIDPKGQRLDYIFAIRGARGFEVNDGLTVQTAAVGMLERHPVLGCSLSDHFSVQATLIWQRGSSAQENREAEYHSVDNGAFLQSPTASEHQLSLYNSQRRQAEDSLLPIPVYNEILKIIEKYKGRERKQRRYRMYHFLASAVVTIGCFIAVWWSPGNFVAFLLMLLSTLSLSAGIIDGLIGGLFMTSEIRALKEFEWEIRNARAAAGGSDDGEQYEAVKDW